MTGLPPEVSELLTKVQLYSGLMVVALATVMGMIAGLMMTVGLREEAKRRFKDAIMGMAIVITAPTIIGIIATVLKAFFPKATAMIHFTGVFYGLF